MGSGPSKSRPTTPRRGNTPKNGTPTGSEKGETPAKKSDSGSGTGQRKRAAPQPKRNKDEENRARTQMSTEGIDVMISYSHADKEAMQKLKSSLERRGITVWVDVVGLKAGVDFLSKIGQAIIDAKLFISLLSHTTIESKYCQDELALAYVSNKPIFPVGLAQPQDLFPKMDTGMKLQLARFQWYLLLDDSTYETDVESLVTQMKANLQADPNSDAAAHQLPNSPTEEDSGKPTNGRAKLVRRQTAKQLLPTTGIMSDRIIEKMSDDNVNRFWENHFSRREYVDWESFLTAFLEDYEEPLKMTFVEQDRDWLIAILEREMEVDDNEGKVTHQMYMEFCKIPDTEELQPFWYAVQDKAVENYTMKEVFDMESTVRVEAIENLGKFRSKSVIEALLDLLTDSDKNVCAVAAISLARTGASGPRVEKQLLKCLNDKDRLVRESGCLALGHLKSEQAVPKLVQLWRNDFISHVREAAQVALEQIGGTEANKAMHMTKVLAEEIRMLTQE